MHIKKRGASWVTKYSFQTLVLLLPRYVTWGEHWTALCLSFLLSAIVPQPWKLNRVGTRLLACFQARPNHSCVPWWAWAVSVCPGPHPAVLRQWHPAKGEHPAPLHSNSGLSAGLLIPGSSHPENRPRPGIQSHTGHSDRYRDNCRTRTGPAPVPFLGSFLSGLFLQVLFLFDCVRLWTRKAV